MFATSKSLFRAKYLQKQRVGNTNNYKDKNEDWRKVNSPTVLIVVIMFGIVAKYVITTTADTRTEIMSLSIYVLIYISKHPASKLLCTIVVDQIKESHFFYVSQCIPQCFAHKMLVCNVASKPFLVQFLFNNNSS